MVNADQGTANAGAGLGLGNHYANTYGLQQQSGQLRSAVYPQPQMPYNMPAPYPAQRAQIQQINKPLPYPIYPMYF